MEQEKASTRYFVIAGGSTLIELNSSGWVRWDKFDGAVPTDLWQEGDSRLTEISSEAAAAFKQ